MLMILSSAAVEGSGSLLEAWQVVVYFVLAPLALLLVVGALAWRTSSSRQRGQYPVLRGRGPSAPAVDPLAEPQD